MYTEGALILLYYQRNQTDKTYFDTGVGLGDPCATLPSHNILLFTDILILSVVILHVFITLPYSFLTEIVCFISFSPNSFACTGMFPADAFLLKQQFLEG